MKFYVIVVIMLVGCREPIDDVIDNSAKMAEQSIKDAQANSKRLDSILSAVNYMGIRDSFIYAAHKLEVMYYKTEEEKYRIKHNKLVDSINRYDSLFMLQLNKK